MIIGITGGTGCGKTTALNVIRDMGGIVIDCDEVYHDLLKTDKALLGAIEARFPGTVEAGVLNRKKLGSIVFADAAALQDLNTITHSAICSAVQQLLPPPPALAAIDAIALAESGLAELCNLTIAVTAPEALRIPRLMARDGISAEYAASRLERAGAVQMRLVICGFDLSSVRREQRAGVIEMIDRCALPCAGVVPYDRKLQKSQDNGLLPDERSLSGAAYANIAGRIAGTEIPLFHGMGRLYRKRALAF